MRRSAGRAAAGNFKFRIAESKNVRSLNPGPGDSRRLGQSLGEDHAGNDRIAGKMAPEDRIAGGKDLRHCASPSRRSTLSPRKQTVPVRQTKEGDRSLRGSMVSPKNDGLGAVNQHATFHMVANAPRKGKALAVAAETN